MAHARHVPFGPAPRPTSDTEIASRVRELLSTLGQPGVRGLDQVTVTAHLDGADVSSLLVDASGVVVGLDRADPVHLASVDVTHREPATVRTFELVAHAASVAEVPVDVAVAASDLRFAWATTSDGHLFVEVQPPSEDDPVVGTARVSARLEDLEGAARVVLAAELEARGLNLTALDIELENRGPRELLVRASATVQKSIMRAAVTLTADASIDDALVLSIRDPKLVGSNPIVDRLVEPFRPTIAAAVRRTIDLAALLPPGVSVSDVSVVADADTVVVSATFG
ncbi:hypothetical protein [Cellulomonas sp. URHD0024]|uniref:hypothetical protein n=1 Tax=Cellulomonas sp. URHD0024 TaxID=1302620 RepID=UPI000413C596|nr:hypothetical protein [Cellulomonas sp. URHD0024]